MSATETKIENLTCCCCGNWTKGRQWWNRDTGYGLCHECAAWMKIGPGEYASAYGTEGVHFFLDPERAA